MTKCEQFLANLKATNKIMIADCKAGHQWTYSNRSGRKGKNFDDTRAKGKYRANCVDGVQWSAKGGSFGSRACPDNALSWYGGQNHGPVWLNGNAKANAEKIFNILWYNGKYTVKQLYEKHLLCEGDILVGFKNMNHTCAYMGYGKSFDSGHAYAKGSGEDAPFTKWIGNLSCKGSKPIAIFRWKSRKKYVVQCGSYKTDLYKDFQKDIEKRFNVKTDVIDIGDEHVVILGRYDGKENAEYWLNEYYSKGIKCQIREI